MNSDEQNKKLLNGDHSCPEIAGESQTGPTEAEKNWALKKEPRPPVPRYVFHTIALILFLAFVGGGIWYYRSNILPEKYHRHADALFRAEKYQEAADYYERVLRLKPDRKNIFYSIAQCMDKLGLYDKALAYYNLQLAKKPNDSLAMLRAGALFAQKGDFKRGLPLLKKAASRLEGRESAWEALMTAAKSAGDSAAEAQAAAALSELYKEPDKVYAMAKTLAELKAWDLALSAYNSLAKLASGDVRAKHGANAAKAMLGYPTNPRFTLIPNVSVGAVKLGATKEEVKAVMGSPDKKDFAAGGMEIWSYGARDQAQSMRVFFMNDKVGEIETRSTAYKTENGLGLSNFLLPKNAPSFSTKTDKSGRLLAWPKGGGLTFYAAGLDQTKTSAKYFKLRVHAGDRSISDKSGFNLKDFFNY